MSAPHAPSEYVQLAFWIERHYPGYVDAYYGPSELKTQAMAGELPPLAAGRAGRLARAVYRQRCRSRRRPRAPSSACFPNP